MCFIKKHCIIKSVKRILKNLCILSVLSVFLFSGTQVKAIFGPEASDITVEVSPENPEPYSTVTIKLSSFALDLDKAMIDWRSGGKVIMSGYGKTSYLLKTLGPNSTIAIDITINSSGADAPLVKNIVIKPTELDLLWQGVDSYTPPFYKGKSFVSPEGLIKVVAMPNAGGGSSQKITYQWKSDDTTVVGASGYGKNSYVFPNNQFNETENISVIASSVGNTYNAQKRITIPTVSPRIIFYKKSPTEGVLYNMALGNESTMSESEEEMAIVAEPYFLSLKGNENSFAYSWKINGEDVKTPSNKTQLTVRPESRGGYATIEIIIENTRALLQKAGGVFTLNL